MVSSGGGSGGGGRRGRVCGGVTVEVHGGDDGGLT